MHNGVKCNSDGASCDIPDPAANMVVCIVTRVGAIMSCLSDYVGILTSFEVEILTVMKPIEVAYERGWSKLWVECDSTLIVTSYKSIDLVPYWGLETYCVIALT